MDGACRPGLHLRRWQRGGRGQTHLPGICQLAAAAVRAPLLLCIGLRNRERLRTPGGGYACGASLGPAGFADAAYIRTAAGSYAAPVASIGKDNAQAASLHGIAHEAAHPFQWVDGASLKGRGQEWQAGRCVHRLLR